VQFTYVIKIFAQGKIYLPERLYLLTPVTDKYFATAAVRVLPSTELSTPIASHALLIASSTALTDVPRI
jgi:hypothetical protein